MAIANPGASREAIEHHYSIGNAFYQLWLDSSLTYSGALWEEGDTLEMAQMRKLDYHLTQARARDANRVLDVGCGWGSALGRMVEEYNVKRAVGLTLSRAQADWISRLRSPRVDVYFETWRDHVPDARYDAIISIGAFEHFAKPQLSTVQKLAAYREYFSRCHALLNPGCWMTLQTIAYGNVSRTNLSAFVETDIFPESELPKLSEIVEASEGLFEIVALRNDREDYERTNREWLSRLRANRLEAVELVGDGNVARYERYLSLFIIGFHTGTMHLLRLTMRRNNKPCTW